MKTKIIYAILFLGIASVSLAQQNPNWNNWTWLLGEWKGEGGGEPGKGGGSFTFTTDLDRKVIVRKSHSEYPAVGGKPKVVHDDLMVVYADVDGAPSKAIYFDNEGHNINYTITYADKSIVLLSDKMLNTPVFRLTYSLLSNGNANTKFEMSKDGQKFTTYIEGKSVKVK